MKHFGVYGLWHFTRYHRRLLARLDAASMRTQKRPEDFPHHPTYPFPHSVPR